MGIDPHTYIDTSGVVFCPRCRGGGRLHYRVRDNPRLCVEDEDSNEDVDYFGVMRDYHCLNCDTEWLMSEECCHET